MTLLLTEVGIPAEGEPYVVLAADRRISIPAFVNGRERLKRLGEREKVLEFTPKRAAIGFFGLATVGSQPMDEWLREFLSRHTTEPTLRAVAESLASELNTAVPIATRRVQASGFHLVGFESGPELWYIRNIDDKLDNIGVYSARQDFPKEDKQLPRGSLAWFRSGDIRAHAAAWHGMDNTLGALAQSSGFNKSLIPKDHARWVAFKLEMIARFYETFSTESIIGRPVDTLLVLPSGVERIAPSPTPAHLRPRKRRSPAT